MKKFMMMLTMMLAIVGLATPPQPPSFAKILSDAAAAAEAEYAVATNTAATATAKEAAAAAKKKSVEAKNNVRRFKTLSEDANKYLQDATIEDIKGCVLNDPHPTFRATRNIFGWRSEAKLRAARLGNATVTATKATMTREQRAVVNYRILHDIVKHGELDE